MSDPCPMKSNRKYLNIMGDIIDTLLLFLCVFRRSGGIYSRQSFPELIEVCVEAHICCNTGALEKILYVSAVVCGVKLLVCTVDKDVSLVDCDIWQLNTLFLRCDENIR